MFPLYTTIEDATKGNGQTARHSPGASRVCNAGNNGNFWSSTPDGAANAYNRNLNCNNTDFYENYDGRSNGLSVRLLKDSTIRVLDKRTLFSMLREAYLAARKSKRNTPSQLKFERNLDINLAKLTDELYGRTWKPSRCLVFIIEDPVKREVVAADFRDRIVHHLLSSWLYPIFERLLIHDAYSCRKEKGTLFGINRIRRFCRAESHDYSEQCYALKLDIKGFFMHIDKDILYRLITDGLERGEYAGIPDIELCQYMIREIVFSNPIDDAIYRSPPCAWADLPRDKSLRHSGPNKGLPIGNLTSQLFANVYLNPLDHYIKRELKIHFYGRYVDDMVLVHRDRNLLKSAIPKIRQFLADTLELELHPRKIQLQSVYHGFEFLGAYILPWRVYPGRRMRKKLAKGIDAVAYNGILCHLNGTGIY